MRKVKKQIYNILNLLLTTSHFPNLMFYFSFFSFGCMNVMGSISPTFYAQFFAAILVPKKYEAKM